MAIAEPTASMWDLLGWLNNHGPVESEMVDNHYSRSDFELLRAYGWVVGDLQGGLVNTTISGDYMWGRYQGRDRTRDILNSNYED